MSTQTTSLENPTRAAIAGLLVLQLVMLASLFAQSEPHPPALIPISAIGPFLSVSLSLAIGALIIGPLRDHLGRALGLFAALLAMVSFGPQKYLDPQFALVWPAVIFGQLCALYILYANLRSWRRP